MEENHRSGRKSMIPEISTEETERSETGKDFIGPGGEHIMNDGQHVTSPGFVRENTWQVADVRRPHVSASHIIQVRNDLFTGKNEAHIMNRKKTEKAVLRKEGDVYVLDLFVKVPSGAAAAIK